MYCYITHGGVSQPAKRSDGDRQLLIRRFEGLSVPLSSEEAVALAGSGKPVEGQSGRRRNSMLDCYIFSDLCLPHAVLSRH